MKSTRAVLVTVLLLVAALVAPAAVSADDTRNHAGRTLMYSSASPEASNQIACQFLAYGKVNSRRVIFTANHCLSDKLDNGWNYYDGRTIVDEDGRAHATTPTSQTHCSAKYDLCYLYLLSGRWPANPHQVYAGKDVNGNFRWTTLSTVRGNSSYDCDSLSTRVGDSVHEYQQDLQTGYQLPYSGSITGYTSSGACEIKTNIPAHASYRHSGSPLMNTDYGNTGSLIGVGHMVYGGGMSYASIREGILAIDAFWRVNGVESGAAFCTSATC